MSKPNEVTAASRSAGLSGTISRNARSRCASEPWVTVTALGRPVDPEVNST